VLSPCVGADVDAANETGGDRQAVAVWLDVLNLAMRATHGGRRCFQDVAFVADSCVVSW